MEINLNDKNEVLNRLEYLYDLIYQSARYQDYAEKGCYEETLEQIKGIKQGLDPLSDIPSVFSNMPVFPVGLEEYEEGKKLSEKWRRWFIIAGVATAVCLVFFFISHWFFLNTISVIGLFATAFLWFLQHSATNGMKKKKKVYDDSVERYHHTIQAFRSSLASYDEETKTGISSAKEYAEKYRAAYADYDEALSEFIQKRKEANRQFMESYEEYRRLNFLPEEYENLIPKLITLLKSGRADSYKEALNMAIQEKREESAEAARQAEEERRTRILEEQAAEAQRHNAAMERAEQDRVKAEQQRVQAEKNRAKAEEQARRNAQKAESEARARANRQCMVCAKFSGCRNRDVPGCGAFVPRR